MRLLLAFTLVSLLVSAIGVYGACAYAAAARTREFGLRTALGASRSDVLWLALRDGTHVALFATLVGFPLAVLLGSRVRHLLYEVEPLDPLTLGAVFGALALVVFFASVAPATRATRVDPSSTMRTE
jgi:putative ABC transport system permease protein